MTGRSVEEPSGLPPAHTVVAEGLRAAAQTGAGADSATVLVHDVSEAEVRFANNTTTTNGVRRDRRVTAIAIATGSAGSSVGVASASGVPDVADLMARAREDARSAPPADDAAPLLDPPDTNTDELSWEESAPETGLGVLSGVLGALGAAFRRAESAGRALYGFGEHRVETVSLGTSTGLTLRHVQPTGAFHLVARSTDGARSSWAGVGTADFADVSVERLEAGLVDRLAWANRRRPTEAGRYQVILPPEAVADLMVGLEESLSLRDAEEGRSVFAAPGGGRASARP